MPSNAKPTPEQQTNRPMSPPPPPPRFCNHCWHLIRETIAHKGTNRIYICCFCGKEKMEFVPESREYWKLSTIEHGPYIQGKYSV